MARDTQQLADGLPNPHLPLVVRGGRVFRYRSAQEPEEEEGEGKLTDPALQDKLEKLTEFGREMFGPMP